MMAESVNDVATVLLLIGLRSVRLHLRFSLNFDFTQLTAQTNHVFRQIEQRRFQAAHLAFNPRAGDRQFTRFIYQSVDNVCANAQGGPLCESFSIDFGLGNAQSIATTIRPALYSNSNLLRLRTRLRKRSVVDLHMRCSRRFRQLVEFLSFLETFDNL